jgi:uncharacterized membrane protein YczE
LVTNLTLDVVPHQAAFISRVTLLAIGIVLNAGATALYIGAGLGAGPRDGLMLGIARSWNVSIRRARTVIELTVLGVGWAMGGSVGVGTAAYALAIGPLVHAALSRESPRRHRRRSECGGATCHARC